MFLFRKTADKVRIAMIIANVRRGQDTKEKEGVFMINANRSVLMSPGTLEVPERSWFNLVTP